MWLVVLDLVNVIFLIFGWVIRVVLMFVLKFVIMLKMFGGKFVFLNSLVNFSVDVDVNLDGLVIIVYLVVSVGVIF